MKIVNTIILITLISFGLNGQLEAQTINTERSNVTFDISNMGFKTVTGVFTGMMGDLSFNENDLSTASFDVCIDANSVDTGNKKRDDHLRNEDFFETSTYPQICFVSSNISKVGSKYKAEGILTMHGISKDASIDFSFAENTFDGILQLDRRDFKIGEKMKKFMVGYEVDIKINCVVE